MIRFRITAIAVALLSASAAVAWPAPDAGPNAAEIVADAGAGSTANLPGDELTGSNEELIAQLKALKESYDELRERQEAKQSIKPAVIGLLLSATYFMLGLIKRVRREEWTSWGKSWLPWGALGLGVAVGFLERYALGGSWLTALIYGASPPGAVLIRELTKVWTKRGT